MRHITSIRGMGRLAEGWKRSGVRIGFVPTMGYLHAGHLSLIKRAHSEIGASGKVVVSVFVNPTQFGPNEDLSRYPRDLKRDLELCRGEGVDAVFTPTEGEMYPGKPGDGYSTYVVEETLSSPMEGISRPGHFRGVTTVVAKLFNIVRPDVAVFGAKDWQQVAVIRRMVRDLNFPVRMVVGATLRERDGLAMSSRNKYLTGTMRSQATVLWHSIQKARKAVGKGHSISAASLKARVAGWVEECPDANLDYVEFFDSERLVPSSRVESGTHMALAVRVGKTRLIDNARL